MADVTGPISTLPGSIHSPPDGTMCDNHPDQPAVVREQGETDSFGSEMEDICQKCVDERRAYQCTEAGQVEAAEARTGSCDWCKTNATDLRSARDYDEGMHGPVYRVCGPCIKRVNEEAQADLDAMDDYGPFDYMDDEDDLCGKCYGDGEIMDHDEKWLGYCTCADGLKLKGEAEARYRARSVGV